MELMKRIKTSDDFWENLEQARERLSGCYIMYGNEIVYVEDVHAKSNGLTARIYDAARINPSRLVKLSDPAFKSFREIPPLGWTNIVGGTKPNAVFMERVPVRQRTHGLSNNNVTVKDNSTGLVGRSREYNFTSVVTNKGYEGTIEGKYPSLEEVLQKLPRDSLAAVSSRYAVQEDSPGMKWFYRNSERVGMISGENLLLFKGFLYLLEELQEAKEITFKDVREI